MVVLYHVDCPKGKIFDTAEAERLLSEGWVDSPAKLVTEAQLAEQIAEQPEEQPEKKELRHRRKRKWF